MSVSVEDVARSVLASVDAPTQVGLGLIQQFVKERYIELVGRVKFRQLRKTFNLYYNAPLVSGTVNVTSGSTTWVGTGTAFTEAHIGWQVRAQYNWYTIQQVTAATQTLVMDVPYAEVSNTAATYFAVQRYIPLDPTVRWIGQVRHPRRLKRLLPRSLNWLDSREPARLMVGPFPRYWAEGPTYNGENMAIGADQRKQIETYPPSTQAEIYTTTAWTVSEKLSLQDYFPPAIDAYVLREGVLIDMYRHLASKAAHAIPPDEKLMQTYANLEARQRTIWDQKIQMAILADRAGDDWDQDVETWSMSEDEMEDRDIATAYDQVLSQWTQ